MYIRQLYPSHKKFTSNPNDKDKLKGWKKYVPRGQGHIQVTAFDDAQAPKGKKF